MQEYKIYVSATDSIGAIRDYANAKNASAPSLVRGVETCLKLRLFADSEGTTPYPIDSLRSINAWKWVMDKDYVETTNYILQADDAGITVDSVTEMVDGVEYTYSEISIPLPHTNTEELVEWLGKSKSQTGLAAELVGYDSNGNTVFVLQLENFTVRNRLSGSGEPTPIKPEYLNEAQVRALIDGITGNAYRVNISDAGNFFTGTNVETALQELGARLAGVETQLLVAAETAEEI